MITGDRRLFFHLPELSKEKKTNHRFTIICNIFSSHTTSDTSSNPKHRTKSKLTMKKIKSENKTKHTVCASFSLLHSWSSSFTFDRTTPRNNFSGSTFAYVVYFSEISRKRRKSVTEMKQRPLPQQHIYSTDQRQQLSDATKQMSVHTAQWIRLEEIKKFYSDPHASTLSHTRKDVQYTKGRMNQRTEKRIGRNSHRFSQSRIVYRIVCNVYHITGAIRQFIISLFLSSFLDLGLRFASIFRHWHRAQVCGNRFYTQLHWARQTQQNKLT